MAFVPASENGEVLAQRGCRGWHSPLPSQWFVSCPGAPEGSQCPPRAVLSSCCALPRLGVLWQSLCFWRSMERAALPSSWDGHGSPLWLEISSPLPAANSCVWCKIHLQMELAYLMSWVVTWSSVGWRDRGDERLPMGCVFPLLLGCWNCTAAAAVGWLWTLCLMLPLPSETHSAQCHQHSACAGLTLQVSHAGS